MFFPLVFMYFMHFMYLVKKFREKINQLVKVEKINMFLSSESPYKFQPVVIFFFFKNLIYFNNIKRYKILFSNKINICVRGYKKCVYTYINHFITQKQRK